MDDAGRVKQKCVLAALFVQRRRRLQFAILRPKCASSGYEASVCFSMRDAWASDPAATSTGADARLLADAACSFPKEGKEAHTRGILG